MDEIITYCHDVKDDGEQTSFKAELVGIIKESCGACERRTGSSLFRVGNGMTGVIPLPGDF
jgi:hypothetical protein